MMLIDITPTYLRPERMPEAWQAVWKTFTPEEQQQLIPQRIQEGVYDSCSDPAIDEELDGFIKSMGNLLHRYDDEREPLRFLLDVGLLSSYGVCDGIEDLLTHPEYQEVLNGDRFFTVFIREIRKEDQPKRGGWRWHKWGPYIGKHTPQHEYLYDEPIDSVFVFDIKEHKRPRQTLTEERALAKSKARQADMDAIASGEKTVAEVGQENSLFTNAGEITFTLKNYRRPG